MESPTEQQRMNHCKLCGKPLDCSLPICKECFIPFGEENPECVSYAFLKEFKYPQSTESISVLDLIRVNIDHFETITPFPKLKTLRLSHCFELKTVKIHDAPLLKALDLANDRKLTSLDIHPSIKLRSLDISFCKDHSFGKNISLNYEDLEYFMANESSLKNIPDSLPNLMFAHFHGCHIPINQIEKLTHCPKLERVYLPSTKEVIDITPFTNLPNLYYIGGTTVTVSKFNPKSVLQIVDSFLIGEEPGFSKLLTENSRKHDLTKNRGKYYYAERLLYGPYPTPIVDRFPQNSDLEQFLKYLNIELKEENLLPNEYDPIEVMLRIGGCLFGTALGDTLGIWAEGKQKKAIKNTLEGGLDITWTHPISSEHLIKYPRGTFTDDTALSLMYVKSLRNNNGTFSIKEAAKCIKNWILHGIEEHNDPRGFGAGGTTISSVKESHFDQDPLAAAKEIYELDPSGCGNGGVMRSGITGCFRFWDEEFIIKTAESFCRITHYSPLCAYSAVVIALAVSRELSYSCKKVKGEKIPLDQTIEEAFNYIPELKDDEKMKDLIRQYAYAENLHDLNLSSHNYRSLQTMGVGLWALRSNLSYSDAIEIILREGADADTNAACAGACLGAKYGFTSLPIDVLQDFFFFACVNKEVKALCAMMGFNWVFPSYEDFRQASENSNSN